MSEQMATIAIPLEMWNKFRELVLVEKGGALARIEDELARARAAGDDPGINDNPLNAITRMLVHRVYESDTQRSGWGDDVWDVLCQLVATADPECNKCYGDTTAAKPNDLSLVGKRVRLRSLPARDEFYHVVNDVSNCGGQDLVTVGDYGVFVPDVLVVYDAEEVMRYEQELQEDLDRLFPDKESERERLEWAIRCVKMEIENPGSSGQQLADKLKRRGIIADGRQLQLELDAQREIKFMAEMGELRADTTILLKWQWPKATNKVTEMIAAGWKVSDETCCPHGCNEGQSWVQTKQYPSIEAVLDEAAARNVLHEKAKALIEELRAMRQERPDEIAMMLFEMMIFQTRSHFTTAGSLEDGEVSKKTMLAIAKAHLTVGPEPPEDKDKELLEWPCPDVPS